MLGVWRRDTVIYFPEAIEKGCFLFCKKIFECGHYFIDAFMHLTISSLLLPPMSASKFFSHLKMKLACFECSFGRSLAPHADSECSWLPRGLILPITHAEKCILLKAVLATGAVFLGEGAIQAILSKGIKVVGPHITWGGQESLSGCISPSQGARQDQGQPGQPQAWSSPWCSWRSFRGLLQPRQWVSRRQWSTCAWARRLANPSGFTFASHLLFGGNSAVRRFMESEETNSYEDNESPDY